MIELWRGRERKNWQVLIPMTNRVSMYRKSMINLFAVLGCIT